MGDLIHRDIITPLDNSPTFVARRDDAEKDREFLASTDPWFRPANFTLGPDGNLYVIDMYRQHIETPLSIPEDLKADMDFLNGSQLGRIYRIRPENSATHEKDFPNLKSMETTGYVDLLSHPSQWWRLQAQRLLLERQDASVIPQLKDLFMKHEDPRTRLHALYVLEGLNALNVKLVEQAMKDVHPGVREHGVILSEKYQECFPTLLRMAEDSSAQVAFQVCLSLGEFSNRQVMETFARTIDRYGEDVWFQTAILSSEIGSSLNFLEMLVSKKPFFSEGNSARANFLQQFSYIVGARSGDGEMIRLLTLLSLPTIKDNSCKLSALNGLAEGLKNSKNKPKTDGQLQEALQALHVNATAEIKKAIEDLRGILN